MRLCLVFVISLGCSSSDSPAVPNNTEIVYVHLSKDTAVVGKVPGTTFDASDGQYFSKSKCHERLKSTSSYDDWLAGGLVTGIGSCGEWDVLEVNYNSSYYYKRNKTERYLVGIKENRDYHRDGCSVQYRGEVPTQCKVKLTRIDAPKADPLLRED